MTKIKKINAHGHLLPEPKDIPAFMKAKKFFWVDDEKKFMYQDNWKRPITDPSFFVKEKIEWMDKNEIDHEVLITLSQLYCNGLDKKDANDVIRFQNDFHAQVQSEYPSHFTCGFVVQPAFIDSALVEIERCTSGLNLKVLCLPTHYLNEEKEWVSTADNALVPIYELANELGLAIEIHPYDAPKMINLKDLFWRFHLVWMCAQTADHYHMFSLLDLARRYPNIRTCFAHGNQFGQVNIGRRMQGYKGRPDLFPEGVNPLLSLGAKNVFFDTLVHDVNSFELLKKRQGVSQIVAGLDDPYPLGEMESVDDCYPGKVIDEALAVGIINSTEKANIWNENVMNWLG